VSETTRQQPAGNIFDLGYRSYDGPRLGRRYAFASLFLYTLLSIWGVGRSWGAKLFPWGLSVIALLPALVLLGIASLAPAEFEVSQPEDYFGFVSIILALFCAAVAPDLIGRDQRHSTLALYFSRALDRRDYAGAKLTALSLSLFLVLYVPQIFLQTGNAVAAADLTDYLKDNVDVIPPVLISSALVAVFMASMAMAIASFTPRRAFATRAIIVAIIILTVTGGILVETLDGDARQYSLLISPLLIMEGVVYWVFDVSPPPDSDLARAGLDMGYYFVAGLLYTAGFLALLYRRISRMGV